MNEFYKILAALSPERRALFEKKQAEQGLVHPGQSAVETIMRRPAGRTEVPLSFTQQRLWFMQQLEPDNIAYNMMNVIRLKGPLDQRALGGAIDAVVARHETLRTRFILGRENEPRQVIEPIGPLPVETVDLSGAVMSEAAAREHIQAIAATPFDLTKSPVRVTLLRLAGHDHLLSVATHHIVSDRWSQAVFIRELSMIYRAALLGETAQLPELPVQYADWTLWERETLRGDKLQKQLDYWTSHLAGELPLLDLPFDRPRGATASFRGAHHHFRFDATLSVRLRELARRQGVSLFTLLLTAYKVLLQRYTGMDDVLVGIDIANRDRAETQGMIGPLVNTLVVRSDLSGDPSFVSLLKQVAERVRSGMAHQDVPLERVVEAVKPERRLGEMAPLFQAKFDLQHVALEPIAPDGIVLERYPLEEKTAKFELRFNMEDVGADISGKVEYATDLFDETTIARLARHYQVLLEAIASEPRQWISALRLMTEVEEKALLVKDERHTVLSDFNDTAAAYSSDTLIHELFEAQAQRTPEAVAVVYDDASLSYGELNARANRLAHHLRGLGVRPDDRVAICVERSLDMIVALLAVLKAGSAYVPLDPAYPAERLAFMLADSAPVAILSHGQSRQALDMALNAALADGNAQSVAPVIDLEDDAGLWADQPATSPDRAGLTPASLAYIIYTSGSTGQPKGVMVEHRNVQRLMAATEHLYEFGPDDVWTMFHSFAFDFSVWEIWGALLYGGRLVVVPQPITRSPDAFYALLCGEGVTILNQTPSAFRQLIAVQPASREQHRLRHVIFGGEALQPASLTSWYADERNSQTRLTNMYGITETTVHVTYRPLEMADTERGNQSPIGKPIPDLNAYILDAHGSAVPIGVTGELYIGGAGVARGYLNRPALTAERFLVDPFSGKPGARMYRTGDLARWHADGTIEYLGRNDFQVKLRGFRIELGEIEARLASHDGVREAVVLARQDSPGDIRLVAYYVAGEEIGAEALRPHLAETLPDYMVPAAYVRLDAMPLTPNGKLNRDALPAPDGAAYTSRGYVAPEGAVEETLAAIWADLLRIDRVGRHDNFFELGGHSLMAIQIIARINAAFGIALPLKSLFESPTVAGMAGRIAEAAGSSPDPVIPQLTIDPALRHRSFEDHTLNEDGQRAFPVSFAQQRLWFLEHFEEVGATYHISGGLRMSGMLDSDALASAFARIVDRHEALRTTFATVDGEPVQHIAPVGGNVTLPEHDLRASPNAEAELARLASEEALTLFDLERGPLIRTRLVKITETEHVLLVTIHHIVSDMWSLGVLITEISALYTAFSQGAPDPLPPLGVQYPDYAVWQRRLLEGDVQQRQAGHWSSALAGAPVLLSLPTDHPRPARQDFTGAAQCIQLDPDLTDALKALSLRNGVTLHMTLLTGWAVLLARLSGQTDVVVGTPTANRARPEIRDLIGFFVNTLALRIDLSNNPSIVDLLGRVKATSLTAQDNQDLPFEQVVAIVEPPRSTSHSAIFQAMFAWQNTPRGEWSLPGLSLSSMASGHAAAKFDLSLSLSEVGEGIEGQLTYATALFEPETIERWRDYWITILEAMTADETQPVERIELLSRAERQKVLVEWNPTSHDVPSDTLIHELFEAQAQRTPEAVAVVYDDASLSYGELNGRANRLAHHLRGLGVRPDDRVAICVERSLDMVVALLAVLKAGGGYVPLDPEYPPERLAFMLADSAPRLVLTTPYLAARLAPRSLPVVDLTAGHDWEDAPSENPDRGSLTAASLAYVIYTSGSTGTPKGVMNEHGGLVNLIAWSRSVFGKAPVLMQRTSFGFDAAVWEFFAALTYGGRLVLARHDGRHDPAYLIGLIRSRGITTAQFVPAQLRLLLAEPQAAECDTLSDVVSGGEALPLDLVRRFSEVLPHVRLHNVYGPTEATVDATIWTCPVGVSPTGVIPLGGPISNTQIYILDAHGTPVPIGVTGELYIGGAGVARGYLNRPALTAERFLVDPFSGKPGARMYRTGDLARWHADGTIEYLGRNDFQVKLRGFRIELGEIEARLASHDGVREAVVLARQDSPGDIRLVAYYVAGEEIGAEALRPHLAETLPDYMVPAAYVRLDAMPLTPNGKLNRDALPAPDGAAYTSRGYVAPEGAVEETLAAIWADLLRIDRVGRHDNFFELGGHSLMAIQIIARMRREGLQCDIRALFEAPTLEGLAATVGTRVDAVVPPNLIPDGCTRITPDMLPLIDLTQAAIDGIAAQIPGGAANIQDIYPLGPLQEGVLFHHLMDGEGDVYLVSGMLAFDSRDRLQGFLGALATVIARHDILRTGFVWEGLDQPAQVVWRHAPLQVEEVELDADGGDAAEQLQQRFDPRRYRLDLGQAPLLRVFIAKDEIGDRWLARLLHHHLVMDHTALTIVIGEVLSHMSGDASQAQEPIPFRRFVAQARLGVNTPEHEAFFRNMLGDVVEPTAPFGLTDVHLDGSGLQEAQLTLEPDLAGQLRRTARGLKVSAASLFHLAWAMVLARSSGRQDVVFGTVLFGRMQGGAEADRGLGMFMNTLPLRITLEDGVATSIERVQAALAALLRHEHAPLSLAQRCSGVPAPAPLFSSLLNYRHSQEAEVGDRRGRDGIEMLSRQERTNYPLVLSVDDLGERFMLKAQVPASVGAERICRFVITALAQLVETLEQDPQAPVAALDVLPEDERHTVLSDFNDTAAAYSSDTLIHELFEAQAQRTPEAVAVVYDDASLSYGELNARANRLAHHLRGLGVRPDDRVAICVERSLDMIVALLAVLKAGSAYVPLDPAYPAERLAFMLADSAPVAILSHGQSRQALDMALNAALADGNAQSVAPVIDLEDDAGLWADQPATSPDRAGLTPASLAYIIYTSGSTGQPKGVTIPHGSLANFLQSMADRPGLCATDRLLAVTTVAFDIAGLELFGPLTQGGTLVLTNPVTARDGTRLIALLATKDITVMQATPAFWRMLVEAGWQGTPGLKMLCGGEALDSALAADLLTRGGELWNLYGPTETTIWSAALRVEPSLLHGPSVPVGGPISNTQIYILDAHGTPVPIGVTGELYIGGAGVARGYLNRPALTAERFLVDPFSGKPGARMYRTGDLARWHADGTIEYLGRNDFQVKLRGFRIELGEIEARLASHDGVREAVVLARQDSPGDIRLVAYYVAGEEIGAEALRPHLAETLPDYMVPAAYVRLDAMPLTPNGKLNRDALPAPDGAAYTSRGYVAPEGAVEETLAAIWADLLRIDRVGRHDNFFELGGHSLMAIQIIARMRREGLQCDIRALFEAPTLEGLAATVGTRVDAVVPPNLIPDGCTRITPDMLPLIDLTQAAIDGIAAQIPGGAANIQDIYPLGPLQEGVLFHHLMDGEGDVYLVSGMLAFDSRDRLQGFLGALATVIARHDILRTGFVWEGLDQPAQVVWRHAPLQVEEVELDADGGDAAEQLQQRFDPRRYRLDLGQAPLLRVFIAKDEIGDRWLARLLHHHLVMDHTALTIVIGEVLSHMSGDASQAQEPIPFRRFVAQARLGVNTPEHEAFFRNMLGDVVEPTAPFGLTDVHLDGSGLQEAQLTLEPDLAGQLRRTARGLKVSAASLFHLAWAMVLARSSGRQDVVFGTVLFGRMQGGAEADRGLGMFMNTLPLRITLEDGVATSIERVQAALAALLRHEHAPLSLAQRCSGVPAPAPLFSSLLNYRHSQEAEVGDRRGRDGIEMLSRQERTNYPLVLSVDDLGERFMLKAQVPAFVGAERICRFVITALAQLVETLEQDPQAPVAALDVLPEDERHTVLSDFNDTAAAYSSDTLIHELFEAQAQRTPEAVAVVYDDASLSYGELNARANRLAHHLRGLGVRPDDRVAICVERSLDMIVALLAVLKAGSAYVPLDPAYPAERLAFMLADSAPVAILSHGQSRQALDMALNAALADGNAQSVAPVIDLEDDAGLWADQPATSPDRAGLTPASLAYIIYTSGSTGQPKGVMVEHRNVQRLMAATEHLYEFGPDDVWTMFHSFAFDFSVWEIWGALLYGGRLVVVPQPITRSPDAFYALLCGEGVTILNQTPSAFRQLIAVQPASREQHRLRHVIFGGEALQPASLTSWYADERNSQTRLTNMYGITETTVHVTYRPLEMADTERGNQSPIGKPIPDLNAYILDAHGSAVPIGVTGELYIGGAGVARGYLNRPALTAERFLVDPFSGKPGARMYRTGDLARWHADGTIEYLGRNDFQVKLRGFRIELGEIEARLASHDGVREAVVLARQDSPGDIRLVAYYVAGEEIGAEALRPHLAETLPDYMVPAAYVRLDAMPLTPNGKLNRDALPAPDGAAYTSRGYVAPEGAVEETLAAIWADLLRIDRVGRHDNFFELGGHSLMAIQIIARMRREGLQCDIRALFEAPTLEGLAATVGTRVDAVVPPNLIPDGCTRITPDMLPLIDLTQAAIDGIAAQIPGGAANIQDIYPLGPLQEGVLFHHLMDGEGDVYLVSGMLAFDSRDRLQGFLGALATVIARHDILRTGFVWEGLDQPAQVVWRHAPLQVEEVELDADGGDAAEQLQQRFDPRRYRLDLGQAPLLRVFIAKDEIGDRWLARLLHHHLVMDHTALTIVIGEVLSHMSGDASQAQEPIPFRRFVAQARLGVNTPEHEAFFRNMLGDVVEPTAPFGLTDVHLDGSGLQEAQLTLEPDLAGQLRRTARGLKVSAASLFHLAWAMVLARSSGRQDVVFGTVLFGRMQGGAEADRGLGMFMNTLPLRITLEDGVATSVERVQAALAALLRHEHAPLSLAQRCSGVPAPAPLFSSLLNYRHSQEAEVGDRRGRDGIEMLSGQQRTNYPLVLSVDDLGERFMLKAQVPAFVGAERICRFVITALAQLVETLEQDPQAPVAALDVLPEDESHTVLSDFNDTAAAYSSDTLIHELFEAQAQRTPEAVAVVYDDASLSYGELNARANRLAHHLRGLGVRPDDRVAICVERSLDMIVALLAVLKAGSAYVPLDPAYPAERLAFMLADSAPVAILSHGQSRQALDMALNAALADGNAQSVAPVIDLEDDAGLWADQPATSPDRAGLTPASLAYIIYTSGSTGQPKGVTIPHGSLANFLQSMADRPGLCATDRLLAVTTVAFDIAGLELFGPLTQGGTLVLTNPVTARDGTRLIALLATKDITVMQATPAFWRMLVEAGWQGTPGLKMLCGGEALDSALAADLLTRGGELWNLYGPTETTIWSAALRVEPSLLHGPSVPVGGPISNTQIYILDAHGTPVPIGVTGELYIGGAGVARGYLNRPALTAERFLVDPFSGKPGARMYRTGDLARWHADGTIEYLGRNDFQVKLRGFRIELGEIEARLASHDGVREAVVLARQDSPGDIRLVAYYVAGEEIGAEALRPHLAETLPDYMVPAAYVRLDAMPLTPNGKLNRDALPAPDGAAYTSRGYVAPEGAVEETLAAIWADLLRIDRVGRHDNFFELGGHSLMAVRAINRLASVFAMDVPLRSLFERPMLADQAAYIEARLATSAAPSQDHREIEI